MARTLVASVKDTRKNYLINGDMRISQRGTSFPSAASGSYSLDRWRYAKSGAMVHTLSQGTDVPTLAQAGVLFNNSFVVTLTTPDTSIAASDQARIEQVVEGYNYAKFAQKPFTLSFWVKATLAGIYCVSFNNSASDRSYIAEYTINSSNTWEYKTISISASPSSGTWNYTNGAGLRVSWILAAGTDYHTTAGSWQTQASVKFSTANQVNGVNTGATSFLITGAMLNEGDTAAPFVLFGEDFEGELAACQRYYQLRWGQEYITSITASNGMSRSFDIPVEMRGNPSGTKNGTWTVIADTGQPAIIASSPTSYVLQAIGASAGTTPRSGFSSTSSAQNITLDAEL